MKILFYMSGGFDNHGPSNHLLHALMEDILEEGHSIHLIERHTTGENPDVPESLGKNPNFSYETVKSKVVKKSAFAKRYLVFVRYAIDSISYLKKHRDIDIVFVQSCPSAPFQVTFAKWFTKKPILYNIQDMFPGSSIASGVMKAKWMQWVFYKLQKIAYKNADYISVISDDMKQRVIEQGVEKEKIITIVNWYDDTSVKEVSWNENRFVKKYNLSKHKFYIQYAGTMGYVFDYKMVINVAERLRENKNIEFHMIGQGSQKELFVKEAKEKQLDNIKFFPLEPQHMVSDVYSACSICLIPLKRGVIGNSVPSKAGLLMACNRTIVNSVDEDSNYYKIFNDYKIGISASNNNPKEVAEAICSLYEDEEKQFKYAMEGHKFGKEYYSRSVNTKKYIETFRNILNHKKETWNV